MSLAEIPASLGALRAELAASRRLAIALAGYPDPDSMASAWALAEIAARSGARADILHIDPVSHRENRLMVRELGIPLIRYPTNDTQRIEYDWFALVDCHHLDSRYRRLVGLPCLCVWDHHPGEFGVDPRVATTSGEVGSTSTLAVRYLEAAGVFSLGVELRVPGIAPGGAPSSLSRLATALLVGIATDTEDYLLAHPADFVASAQAMELGDRALFRRIHRRAYSIATMEILQRALDSVVVRGAFGVAWVGRLPATTRDSIPQVADLLVSRLDIDTVVVFGHVGNTLDGSLRTLDPKLDPAELIRRALALVEGDRQASGGGREGKGGFRWELGQESLSDVERLREEIQAAFLAIVATDMN